MKTHLNFMNDLPVAHLSLKARFNDSAIDMMVRYNIRSLCFEEPEKRYIHKTSVVLAIDFLNFITSNKSQSTADKFIKTLKTHVLLNTINRAESTGLLFTWIPIIMKLNQAVIEANETAFMKATEHLEFEVHKFAVSHLKLSLNRHYNKE